MPVARTWFIRSFINFYLDVELNHSCYNALEPLLKEYLKEIEDRLRMSADDIIEFSLVTNAFNEQLYEFFEMHEPNFTWHETFPEFVRNLEER